MSSEWNKVKPGAGAYVEQLSTDEEMAMVMGGRSMAGMSPEDILMGFEEGLFEFLRDEED